MNEMTFNGMAENRVAVRPVLFNMFINGLEKLTNN